VRTTLTLDEDVAAKLRTETRRTGRSFKEIVNAVLHRGSACQKQRGTLPRFVVRARSLGLRPELDYDKTSDLLEQIEGRLRR
jgi:hypothetical protein